MFKKKNLERKVCVCTNALINGLNNPPMKIPNGDVGIHDNSTYLHPCMRKPFHMTREELEQIKRYPRNERKSHKRYRGKNK